MAEAVEVIEEFVTPLKKSANPRVIVMTVATNEPDAAAAKYKDLFRKYGIKQIDTINISERDDAFDDGALKKLDKSDALFFTGGDQLNVTSLMGGTPLHQAIRYRVQQGFLIAGTSAGAAMMSNSMITSGRGDRAPRVGAVEIAPGMDLLPETIIDTHFSQRGRYGRLLTAIAHYPQDIGIGIDERTAIVVRGKQFKVVGDGSVTVIDGSKMRHCDLPYRSKDESIGMIGLDIHVLPAGYKYNLATRDAAAPALKRMAGAAN